MGFLHNAVIAVLIFVSTLVSGTLGFFHLSQPHQQIPILDISSRPTSPTTQSTAEEQSWAPIAQIEATSTRGWIIRNGFIYYEGAVNTSGVFIERMLTTNAATFFISTIDADFGRDDNNVYYDGQIIEGAEANSFKVLGPGYESGGYAKDNLHVYFEKSSTSGTVAPITGADPTTFIGIGFAYAKDKYAVYESGLVVSGADPNTFSVIGLANATSAPDALWAKDRTHVFVNGETITNPPPDPSSVRIILDQSGNVTGYVADKTYLFDAYDGSLIMGADPRMFTVLNDWYAKDSTHVYSYECNVIAGKYVTIGTPIEGADAAHFILVDDNESFDATDGVHQYYQGCQII
jgi:hypothetical protein